MAYLAKDKTPFTNRMGMVSYNNKLDAKNPLKPLDLNKNIDSNQDQDQDNDEDKKSILDDPIAMQEVTKLKDQGYTAEDVQEAFDSLGEDNSQEAPIANQNKAAAGLQIPGIS